MKPITEKPERRCRECGCTEDNACITPMGPCYWVTKDLCSACEAYLFKFGRTHNHRSSRQES